MKLFRLLPLLLLGLVFVKQDTSACASHNTNKEAHEKLTRFLARSAHKALKEITPSKVELHPDFMIGNSLLRF